MIKSSIICLEQISWVLILESNHYLILSLYIVLYLYIDSESIYYDIILLLSSWIEKLLLNYDYIVVCFEFFIVIWSCISGEDFSLFYI